MPSYAKHTARKNTAGPAIAFERPSLEEGFIDDGADEFPIEIDNIDIDSIIALTARLAQVLAEEADYLGEMKISLVGELQKEKLALLDAIEAQKKFIDRNPELLARMSDDEALELAQIVEIFQSVLQENHRRVLVARDVNRTVVEAITAAVKETDAHSIYDERGRPEAVGKAISMNLNQTI